MRVKTAKLKTHLSHYLRVVQETGEDIEVCVRDTPVAYLTRSKEASVDAASKMASRQLEEAFQLAGLTLIAPLVARPGQAGVRRLPAPQISGDERTDIDTTQETRRQRDW